MSLFEVLIEHFRQWLEDSRQYITDYPYTVEILPSRYQYCNESGEVYRRYILVKDTSPERDPAKTGDDPASNHIMQIVLLQDRVRLEDCKHYYHGREYQCYLYADPDFPNELEMDIFHELCSWLF